MKKLLLLPLLFSSTAMATPIMLDAVDAGWYNSQGLHYTSSRNIAAGVRNNVGFSNFLKFDLSSIDITEQIDNATISFYASDGKFTSKDFVETFTLWDVDSANVGVATRNAESIYYDLSGGEAYGSHTFLQYDGTRMKAFNISLNKQALLDLNAAILDDQTFFVGGSVTTAVNGQLLWDNSVTSPAAFISFNTSLRTINTDGGGSGVTGTVSEPQTFALLGLGLLGIATLRRKKPNLFQRIA